MSWLAVTFPTQEINSLIREVGNRRLARAKDIIISPLHAPLTHLSLIIRFAILSFAFAITSNKKEN